MSPDDLIAAFEELAQTDPEMAIKRTAVGQREKVWLADYLSGQAARRFRALASDAAALFNSGGQGDAKTRWLRMVLDGAPELVERSYLGDAILGDDKRVPFDAVTIPNAASASALVVRRLRERATLAIPTDVLPEAAVAAAQERCPTLLDALVYLGRRHDIRPTTEAERAGANAHRTHVVNDPIAFAIKWVHSRCT